jgi:L-Lysine epsilon oxidase N-terminal
VPPKGTLKPGRVPYIVWETTPIPSCRGFAIYRREHGGTEELLTNRVGWRDDKKDPKVKDQPSRIWPFQTFTWADYKAHAGQVLSNPRIETLGTLATDGNGRLLVLGGKGESGSVPGASAITS